MARLASPRARRQASIRKNRVARRGRIGDTDAMTTTSLHAARDPEQAYHYAVIARAIAEIDAAGGAALPLEELAARVGLSPAHFQRTFSRWAGVSPKQYQQYLALDQARRLLQNRFTTLEASLNTGLSSPGRLHDLFLKWEAMSPGEYARGGDGLTISYAALDTPFGAALAMATERGLCGLAFTADIGGEAALADMRARWPRARYRHDPERVEPLARAVFGGGRAPTRLHLIGAPFQIKVWEALLAIPSGHVTTYSEIARAIGRPAAVRAVGTAVGRNPIGWLIPCHRALRKSGGLGGYHWGLPVKRAMLAWEAARLDATTDAPV
jgi:AraC family transcriptional regulator of adaptative response/methylated-DNA-[protein]-cysteine methyltransferase